MSYSNVQILSALIFSNVRVLLMVNMDVIKYMERACYFVPDYFNYLLEKHPGKVYLSK